jgi:hypothetical protein
MSYSHGVISLQLPGSPGGGETSLFRLQILAGVLGLFAVCLAGTGCGKTEPVQKDAQTSYQHLMAIRTGYWRATAELGRPPENPKEILAFMQNASGPKEDLLRSPDDGQEYKILWGVDVREYLTPRDDGQFPVLAYEQQGKDGRRYVLQVKNIVQMTDEEFKNAWFPAGFKAPS